MRFTFSVRQSARLQSGASLIISMIMLVVLTLIVVSAIRFGNVNLRIANNTQAKAEAAAATQVALERFLVTAKAASNLDAIAATSDTVVTGGASYKVTTAKPVCQLSKPVLNAELDATSATDQKCFESADADKAIVAGGTLTTAPSACNSQQWSVQADVSDGFTGAQVTSVQGFSIRVPAQTQCP